MILIACTFASLQWAYDTGDKNSYRVPPAIIESESVTTGNVTELSKRPFEPQATTNYKVALRFTKRWKKWKNG